MIEVIKPGLLITIQDQGRWGYQRFGIGTPGALDPYAQSAANFLVGNPEEAAGLEITLLGFALKFHQNTLPAITGADLSLHLDNLPFPNWTACYIPSGSILSFSQKIWGVRTYLAVWGGIAIPPIMGSCATYLLGRFGGLEGRHLKAGDLLPLLPLPQYTQNFLGRVLPESMRPPYIRNIYLRVILGAFADYFSEEGLRAFLSSPYTITLQSDRMGYRLHGAPITLAIKEELITCGLANGTIQVPPDGQTIILLADRQTIGGYPIIVSVINDELPLVAQCAPGDKLHFRTTSLLEWRRKPPLKIFGGT